MVVKWHRAKLLVGVKNLSHPLKTVPVTLWLRGSILVDIGVCLLTDLKFWPKVWGSCGWTGSTSFWVECGKGPPKFELWLVLLVSKTSFTNVLLHWSTLLVCFGWLRPFPFGNSGIVLLALGYIWNNVSYFCTLEAIGLGSIGRTLNLGNIVAVAPFLLFNYKRGGNRNFLRGTNTLLSNTEVLLNGCDLIVVEWLAFWSLFTLREFSFKFIPGHFSWIRVQLNHLLLLSKGRPRSFAVMTAIPLAGRLYRSLIEVVDVGGDVSD